MFTTKVQFQGSNGKLYGITMHTPPGSIEQHVVDWGNGMTTSCVSAESAVKTIFDACKSAKVKLTPVKRTPAEIAREIGKNWANVYFGAVPYLQAMRTLQSADDAYGLDDGRSIILYFLANANSYRGAVAKAHKEELKALIK